MNRLNDEQFIKFLKDAIAPICDQEPQQDLWPKVLQKLDGPGIRVRWFDFVLIAIVIFLCVSMPEAISGLLFNL